MLLHVHVKEMPRKVNHRSVTASVFLGWSRGTPPGYRCFLVAQDMSVPDDPMLCAYTMRASSINAAWVRHEEWFNISASEAEGLLREHLAKGATD